MAVRHLVRMLAAASLAVGMTVAGSGASAGTDTFTVDVTTDGVDAIPGNGSCATAGGDCTLRAALMESNALAGAQTVVVPKDVYHLTVTGAGDAGDLDVTDDLTIQGRGSTVRWDVAVPLASRDRILHLVGPSGQDVLVTIRDITLRQGRLSDLPGAGIAAEEAVGQLTADLEHVALVGNVIVGTTSQAIGGGLFVGAGTDVTLTDSTVAGNEADRGTGIFVSTGTLRVERSTISGNAGRVGGIVTFGTLLLLNSTVSGNTSTIGGGGVAVSGGAAAISQATIANNDGADVTQTTGAMSLQNSIVGGACSLTGGANSSFGGNAESGDTCEFLDDSDRQDATVALKPIADNGGPTLTHALGTASDALGLANGSFHVGCSDTDQRGVPRGGDPCDSGAYELARCEGSVVTRVGTPARDVLSGSGQADSFLLLGGNDLAKGKGGADAICGGTGRDRLEGGGGNDDLNGGPDRDTCIGGKGTDRARGCERKRSIP
ncbi:MAG: choice-of-anchor Q domain-containing protein [Actinomycetota bacterium]